MKSKVGLWIDHRKAIVVAITERGQEIRLTITGVETEHRSSGESLLSGVDDGLQEPFDDARQQAFTAHLGRYYDTVIASIRDAEAIMIFGPGEAGQELKKRLEEKNLGGLIVSVEAADKMPHRQLAAKVRQHFSGAGVR